MTGAPVKAAFLDRDGVINVDVGYLSRPEDMAFASGAVEALARLRDAGYLLIVVTNQSGIGRGYYDEAAFEVLTAHIGRQLRAAGVELAATYHCPHLPDDGCLCRKPRPGMLHNAITRFGIAPDASILIGDKASDISAGRAAGVGRCYLIAAGLTDERSMPDATFGSLYDCAVAITA